MPRSLLRPLCAVGVFLLCATGVAAQRPTPEQAQALLQGRPELLQQLRDRLTNSGLTPDQIRARLRAEGYPENLLDAYMPTGGTGGAGMGAGAGRTPGAAGESGAGLLGGAAAGTVGGLAVDPRNPGSDVFSALRALGIADSSDFDFPGDTLRQRRLRGDTLLTPFDSLNDERLRDEKGRILTPYEQFLRLRADSARRDSGLAIFGRELFDRRRNTTQFEANLAGPVDPGYRLGPGDRLVLILTGDVEQAYQLDVTREGFIVIPQVGQLQVNNLTLAQLEDLLFARLGRAYSGVRRGANATTRFTVTVARVRSNQVFVVGDVERPGSYRISAAASAMAALYAAGGPTESGTFRNIQVRRGGRVVATLDLYDYLLRGDQSNDPRLQNGDVLFVGPHTGRVRIAGEVMRPATYEIGRNGTLAELIRAAGGLRPTAARSRIQLERLTPARERTRPGSDRAVLDVSAANGDVPALALVDGDVVKVLRVADRVRNRVTVRGNVFTPGTIGLSPGMRLSEALRRAGGLKPDTYLGQVLITRLQSDSTFTQLRATLADTLGSVVNDPVLQEEDDIRVFGRSEFRPIRYVAINGAVRRSGRYPYREGMTVRDLVLLAGGLQESALLTEAEIARLPRDRREGVTASTVRIPLDSSYLFERGADGRYAGPPGLPSRASGAAEAALDPYDNVLILRQPDWELQRNVFIGGEVRYPGTYSLTRKTERLSDLLTRAGGLTQEAYADGVQFTRKRNRMGRVGIDLPGVLKDAANRDNLILFDGDSIVIPRFDAVVRVDGAVNSPTALPYVRGKPLDYYIRAAGGGRRDADLPRAYVTQPNGRVDAVVRRRFLPDGQPEPRPGAIVTVPTRDPSERAQNLAAATTIAQIAASLAAVITSLVVIFQQARN